MRKLWGNCGDPRMDYVIFSPWEEEEVREQETELAEVTIPQNPGKNIGMLLQKSTSSQITEP